MDKRPSQDEPSSQDEESTQIEQPPETDPQDVRRRLVEISDELSGLDPMAFAAKHELNLEADQLRNRLSSLIGSEMEAANREWSDRSGRRGGADSYEDNAARIAVFQAKFIMPPGS